MTESPLADLYRDYIACLNRRDWANLGRFVQDDARHNGRPFGLAGYRAMLDREPKGLFLDLPVNGRRVVFAENVFYRFRNGKIEEVWSVIDKAAIEAQL